MVDCELSLSSMVVVLCGHRLTVGSSGWHGASRGKPDICVRYLYSYYHTMNS